MASGSSSTKGKGTFTKNKSRPMVYNDLDILLQDPKLHISKHTFNREVPMILSIDTHFENVE